MAKNIVVCADGTGNGIEPRLSNVLKLYRMTSKSARQRVFYGPGVGTLGEEDEWAAWKQDTKLVLGLATGYGIDDDILDGYRFLVNTYEEGDHVFLFGFSRGAYTARALAGLLYTVGILTPDQLNLSGNGLAVFKQVKAAGFDGSRRMIRVTGSRYVPIKFVGVWDTVASVLVPRRDRFYVPTQVYLPYTRKNPCVQVFRQALAIDERRRMFRPYHWTDPQPHRPRWFAPEAQQTTQDIRQVWFAGVHSDVGGGYAEEESGLSKFPLGWMVDQAVEHGLEISDSLRAHLVDGKPLPGGHTTYAPPAVDACLHDSMNAGWELLEWIPKSNKYRDGPPGERSDTGWYLPRAERRYIPPGALVHRSVVERMHLPDGRYTPPNLPAEYRIEE